MCVSRPVHYGVSLSIYAFFAVEQADVGALQSSILRAFHRLDSPPPLHGLLQLQTVTDIVAECTRINCVKPAVQSLAKAIVK